MNAVVERLIASKPNGHDRGHDALSAEPVTAICIPADAEKLTRYWPIIRHGCLTIKSYTPHSTWTPEHVRLRIVTGKNELWLCVRGDELVGFTVTEMSVDPFQNVPNGMFVWLAYKVPGEELSATDQMDEFITQIARDRGCTYMDNLTARRGLCRLMARNGWKEVLIVMRKELYPTEEKE